AVIEEAAFLDHEPPRVQAGPASVPADRALSSEALDQLDAAPDMLALLGLGYGRIIDPAPAMGDDVRTQLGDGLGDLRVALQGQADGVDSRRHAPLLEGAEDAPDPGPGAVVVEGFHVEVAGAQDRRGGTHLGEDGLGPVVTIEEAVLRPFLIIDDEIE